MITIERNLMSGKRDFNIYNEDEAKKEGISYLHWSKCSAGDYGISDDGYIGECVYRQKYKTNTLVTMCYGKNWLTKNAKIIFMKNHAMGVYSMVNPRHWLDAEIKSRRFRDTIDAYVMQIMSDKQVDWDLLGNIYRPDQKSPAITARRLFKEERVKKMVKDELKKILTDKGITSSFVLDTILEAIEVAKMKQDAGNMLKASSELSDYLQMKPEKKTVTDRLEIDVSKQINDTIEKESKKMIAEREVEIDP